MDRTRKEGDKKEERKEAAPLIPEGEWRRKRKEERVISSLGLLLEWVSLRYPYCISLISRIACT